MVSRSMGQTTEPVSVASVQEVFRLARLASGIHPEATTHSLRHGYATHLLEEGISLRQISSYLGHESLDTTAIYTHLTKRAERGPHATSPSVALPAISQGLALRPSALELAEVLLRHWPEYRQRQFGAQLLPSHRRAVQAILTTAARGVLGGEVYFRLCQLPP